MIIYYRDPTVQVTSTAITVDDRVYPFDEVSRVWHTRRQRSWRELAGRGAWGLVYLLPFLGAILGLAAAVLLDLSFGTRVIVIVASILVGLSAGPLLDLTLDRLDTSFDRGLHLHEIWVEHRGRPVRILQTWDRARFGRIYRAVQRAAEAGPPSLDRPAR
jgi:hypothetical protein